MRIYICHKCKNASTSKRCCNHICHVYTGDAVVPNDEYKAPPKIQASGINAEFYCNGCEKGLAEPVCENHKSSIVLIKHKDLFISQSLHEEITINRFSDPRLQSFAVQKCKEYAERHFANPKTEFKVQQDVVVQPNTKICPSCCCFSSMPRCCGRHTKIITQTGALGPSLDFVPPHGFTNTYHKDGCDFYCVSCGVHRTENLCGCGNRSLHRWYDGKNGSGYVNQPTYIQAMSTCIPSEAQRKQIISNYEYLVSKGLALRVPTE